MSSIIRIPWIRNQFFKEKMKTILHPNICARVGGGGSRHRGRGYGPSLSSTSTLLGGGVVSIANMFLEREVSPSAANFQPHRSLHENEGRYLRQQGSVQPN